MIRDKENTFEKDQIAFVLRQTEVVNEIYVIKFNAKKR
jgi:hypothetical protein